MPSWLAALIGSIVGAFAGPLKKAFKGYGDALKALWTTIQKAMRDAKARFSTFRKDMENLLKAFNVFSKEVKADLTDIRGRFVPNYVTAKINAVQVWAANLVAKERTDRAREDSRIIAQYRAADALIRAELDFLERWAAQRLSVITNAHNTLASSLQHALRGPQVLAEWLLAALLAALWRYVQGNLLSIGRWVRNESFAFTLWGAARLESIIARLL